MKSDVFWGFLVYLNTAEEEIDDGEVGRYRRCAGGIAVPDATVLLSIQCSPLDECMMRSGLTPATPTKWPAAPVCWSSDGDNAEARPLEQGPPARMPRCPGGSTAVPPGHWLREICVFPMRRHGHVSDVPVKLRTGTLPNGTVTR